MIDSHNFGSVVEGVPEYTTLTGTYTPATTGLYTLEIENTRNAVYRTDTTNFIDNIKLEPIDPMLSADKQILAIWNPTDITMDLAAGPAFANRNYWMFLGYTGTFPGVNLSGINIPLNFDALFELGLSYPGILPGTSGFFGTLNGSGEAEAFFTWNPSADFMGLTLYFSYVVLSPGGGLPILAASNPVNLTVVLLY
ncbi:MAG: hypothetical protein KJ645_12635 [Planctomycetes bacterium]|nr:hypothetical protein [Planctomycetota bacterium]